MLHKRSILVIALSCTAPLHSAAEIKKLSLSDCYTRRILGDPSDSTEREHIVIEASVVTPSRTVESYFGFIYAGYKASHIAFASTLAKGIRTFLEENPGKEFDAETFLEDTVFNMAGTSIPALVKLRERKSRVSLILSKFCYPNSENNNAQDIATLDNHGIILAAGWEYIVDDLNRMFKDTEVSQADRFAQIKQYAEEVNKLSRTCIPISVPALVINAEMFTQYAKQQLASIAP